MDIRVITGKHSLKKMSDEWVERMKRPGIAENYARYRDALTFDDVWGGSPKSPVQWFNRGEKMEFEDGKRVA